MFHPGMGDVAREVAIANGEVGSEQRGTVRAVSRALAVLRAFRTEEPTAALSDIAARAHLDRATARRMLLTLIEEGLVRQDNATQRYALTLRVLELAAAVPSGGLREEARPIMQRVARETGATVFLSVRGGPGALCLERVDGSDPVQVKWWAVGSHMAWNCGAGPRLLLAHMAPAEAATALQHVQVLTEHTQTDAARLLRHLEQVRQRGYEVTVDDVAVGLSAVAVPIAAESDQVAALSIGGLTARLLDGKGGPKHLDMLRDAARDVAANLRGGHFI